jgi:hypothetical protein
LRSENVRQNELACRSNRTINVRFGGKVENRVHILRQSGENFFFAANIAFDELVTRFVQAF